MTTRKWTARTERQNWANHWEFYMTCISSAIGLGNIWRFPFICYENGGGSFLLSYLIVLIFIGSPLYYLELVLGQFSNSNCVSVWDAVPAFRGIGYAQALSAFYVLSYYMILLGLSLFYLVMSCQATLPWTVCEAEWVNCLPVGEAKSGATELKSSAEYYYTEVVLQSKTEIDTGIGIPLWPLALCLFVAWLLVFAVNANSLKTCGRMSYFFAIFPYSIMSILFIRAVTLPGAAKGILFFITPNWNKFCEAKVWFAAVTQAFFSLSICSGVLIMFASYNKFERNMYRDSLILTAINALTSILSGLTIFSLLGNLALQLGYEDVTKAIGSSGSGLTFITFPIAIGNSPFIPQLFAFLFFLMLLVLGVFSGVALHSTVNTIIVDYFPNIPSLAMCGITCVLGFITGILYTFNGSQHILILVDYYAGALLRLCVATFELGGIFWIYGLESLCVDIEFMLRTKTCFYWRICWTFVIPVVMFALFVYSLIPTEQLKFEGKYSYPLIAYVTGALILFSAVALIPLKVGVTIYKLWSHSFKESIKMAFKPMPTYGPSLPKNREAWLKFTTLAIEDRYMKRRGWFHHICMVLTGAYRWGPSNQIKKGLFI